MRTFPSPLIVGLVACVLPGCLGGGTTAGPLLTDAGGAGASSGSNNPFGNLNDAATGTQAAGGSTEVGTPTGGQISTAPDVGPGGSGGEGEPGGQGGHVGGSGGEAGSGGGDPHGGSGDGGAGGGGASHGGSSGASQGGSGGASHGGSGGASHGGSGGQAPPAGATDACDGPDDCPNGQCFTEADSNGTLIGGFCRQLCENDAECNPGRACLSNGDSLICWDRCDDDTVCRHGWACSEDPNRPDICVPDCRIRSCVPGLVCNLGTGLCEADPAGPPAPGEPCTTNGPECGVGLLCQPDDDDGNGHCRRVCDAAASINGCEADEFCVSQAEATGDRRPGYCHPSDHCDPMDPDCDTPNATCAPVPPITLCLPAGDADERDPCGFSGDAENLCQVELLCVSGICRRACQFSGDCNGGDTCVDYSDQVRGDPVGFCHPACDVLTQQGCDPGEVCALEGEASMLGPFGSCVAAPQSTGIHGDACEGIGGPYYGTCDGAHMCTSVVAEQGATCHAFCTRADRSMCSPTDSCVADIIAGLTLGLCAEGCTVLGPQSGCPDGQRCGFTGRVGEGADGNLVPWGMCGPGPQRRDTGERCTFNPARSSHDCINGHICAIVGEGNTHECVRLCDDRPDSSATCDGGQVCLTQIWEIEGDFMGVCVGG